MAFARTIARTSGKGQTVSFSVASDRYQMPGVPDLKDPSIDYAVILSEGLHRVTMISADFGGDAEVIFDGFGIPDTGGSVIVQAADVRKTIVLDKDTRKATVE